MVSSGDLSSEGSLLRVADKEEVGAETKYTLFLPEQLPEHYGTVRIYRNTGTKPGV